MNLERLKRNINQRVQLRPIARRFDGAGLELERFDDDWVIEAVTIDGIRISNPRTGHTTTLGGDHVHHYTSNPDRSRAGVKHGFLTLNVQISLRGPNLTVEPNAGPGQPAATTSDYPAALPIPMSSAALCAYANGHPRPIDLIHAIGRRRRIEVARFDPESAYLNEQIAALKIKTVQELDELVSKHASVATRLCDYLSPQGSIDAGFILSRVLDVVAIERAGKAGLTHFHESLRYSTGGAHYAEEIYKYYEEIKSFG
jgi:hypothetical protein